MQTFSPSALSSLSAREFEEFVADYLRAAHPEWRLEVGGRAGALTPDFVATTPDRSTVVVEVKHVLIVERDLVERELNRRDEFRKSLPNAKYLLVVSGTQTSRAAVLAADNGLDVIDGQTLLAAQYPALLQKWGATLQSNVAMLNLDFSQPTPSRLDFLRSALPTIATGTEAFVSYQEWVRDVCELLFVPPLGPIHYENSDESRRNRRDVILQNWAHQGFWNQLRLEYQAHQVIVDAKNHGAPIGKRPILEIAHYLKPYACGLFGMVFCRKGAAKSGTHAAREEWIGSRRLILVLSDDDVLQMLMLMERGDAPEELLRHRIGEFRQSL